MITISGARWWKRRTPVPILIAAEDTGVLLAIGSGNYVELAPRRRRSWPPRRHHDRAT